jgi:hypothetical protein
MPINNKQVISSCRAQIYCPVELICSIIKKRGVLLLTTIQKANSASENDNASYGARSSWLRFIRSKLVRICANIHLYIYSI